MGSRQGFDESSSPVISKRLHGCCSAEIVTVVMAAYSRPVPITNEHGAEMSTGLNSCCRVMIERESTPVD
jgi:hypothetical protein